MRELFSRKNFLVALTYLKTGATIILIAVPAIEAMVSALDTGKASADLISNGEHQ